MFTERRLLKVTGSIMGVCCVCAAAQGCVTAGSGYHFAVGNQVTQLQPGSPVEWKSVNCLDKHLHGLLEQIQLPQHHAIPAMPHPQTHTDLLKWSQCWGGGGITWTECSYRYRVKPSSSPAVCFLLSSTLSSLKASLRTWPFSRGPAITHKDQKCLTGQKKNFQSGLLREGQAVNSSPKLSTVSSSFFFSPD